MRTVGAVAASGHGIEALRGIIRHAVEQGRIGRIARRDRDDRVAVGRSARGLTRADIAAGPADILDIELLAEAVREPLRNQPRREIVRTSGGERHDDPDGLAG